MRTYEAYAARGPRSTRTERGPTCTCSPARRPDSPEAPEPPEAPAGSNVSIATCHATPGRTSGMVKSIPSHHPFTSTRKSSSSSGGPSGPRSGASDPYRYTPSASAERSSQHSCVIGAPAGVYQPNSAASTPVRYRCRRNTGCARRSAITDRVNASSDESAAPQSTQEISLSWQYALLLPPWVRPISSPPSSSGTPNESSSVHSIARDRCPRSASTAASVLSPSAPEFHDRLSEAPSRFDSPFASLCLPSYATRSRSVNPSCTVMMVTEAVGRRRASP